MRRGRDKATDAAALRRRAEKRLQAETVRDAGNTPGVAVLLARDRVG